jgi:hypothetical protein
MSAPATAVFTLESVAILLAAQAIAEAAKMGAEYADTLEKLKRQEAGRQAERRQAQAARATRMADLKAQAENLEARCLRLSGLMRQEESLPLAPTGMGAADAAAWSAYVRRLETTLAGMESRLDSEEKQSAARQALTNVAGGKLDLRGVLTLYLAQRRAERNVAEQAAWRETVERLLARLDLPAGEPLPVRIEALARAVILAETPTRAELLGNELRREVHLYRAQTEQARQDAALAAGWLRDFALADSFTASFTTSAEGDSALIETLQAVAAGLLPLDAATRQAASRRAEDIARALREQEEKAAAVVLEQSLRDLGYQVEEVGETLFAEGGMIHFQRPGWGDYQVRLRANVKEKNLNFNVVRAKSKANRDAAAQKKQDFIAEERWCSEFPKFLATLAARGLKLDVTRQLEAGELPVQEVDADRLPRFESETQERRKNTLKSMGVSGERH